LSVFLLRHTSSRLDGQRYATAPSDPHSAAAAREPTRAQTGLRRRSMLSRFASNIEILATPSALTNSPSSTLATDAQQSGPGESSAASALTAEARRIAAGRGDPRPDETGAGIMPYVQ
jgi:hypothetical protein